MFEEGITLITATGGRSKAFELCGKYVMRFHRPDVPVQWIIVDDVYKDDNVYKDDDLCSDYKNQTSMVQAFQRIECLFIKPRHHWHPGLNTLGLNINVAIPHVKYDSVMFIEDDDWYAPEYMKYQYEQLKTVELVGEVPSRYYHVPFRQYRVMSHSQHASLCQTAVRSSVLPLVQNICEQSSEFIDIRLWGRFEGIKTIKLEPYKLKPYCVGIKGMPGRPGIGIGHNPSRNRNDWKSDQDLTVLRSWIGNDVSLYYQ